MSRTPAGRDALSDGALFAALAHPTRREILLVVAFRGGAMSAGQIAERFSCQWPTVTRHLHVLQQAGLLEVRIKGRGRIYRLRRGRLIRGLEGWARWFKRR